MSSAHIASSLPCMLWEEVEAGQARCEVPVRHSYLPSPKHSCIQHQIPRTAIMCSQARRGPFEKGQSKRIWGELYKVLDSSDVIIQVRVCKHARARPYSPHRLMHASRINQLEARRKCMHALSLCDSVWCMIAKPTNQKKRVQGHSHTKYKHHSLLARCSVNKQDKAYDCNQQARKAVGAGPPARTTGRSARWSPSRLWPHGRTFHQ